mgnify:FL=1
MALRQSIDNSKSADLAAKVAAFTAAGGKVTQGPELQQVPRRQRSDPLVSPLIKRLRALANQGCSTRYATMIVNDEGLADRVLTPGMVAHMARMNGFRFRSIAGRPGG